MTSRGVVLVSAVWLAALAVAVRAQAPGAAAGPAPRTASEPAPSSGGTANGMFAPSSECLACHNNLTSPTGEDVSIGASWRSTIMANSARDPYFHAGVRREVTDHPTRAADIEDECAACHMPTAQRIAHASGGKGQIFAHLPVVAGEGRSEIDRLAGDGITCTVCHQIAPDRLGSRESFNGNFTVAPPLSDGTRRAFGPFSPDRGRRRIMHSVTGFEQAEAPHVRESEFCATCHTLITEALGSDGRVIGSLPEQMNYQEWRHSAYFEEQRSCQSCHMPRVAGPVRVSSVLGEYRDGLSRHLFVGGNAFMLRILNRFRTELGVEATPAELEATARATIRQLENDTAVLAIERASVADGTLAVDVSVKNLTGHKFPTGYPSRRTWIHLTARGADGRVLFESGRVEDSGSIDGNDNDANGAAYEPHYAEITRADQVQIYETIMGTPAGAPTTGLLQATQYLKDNRLLPRGFDKQSAPAEIGVFGTASADADFTGTGDVVRYRVPIGTSDRITVEAELRYQPIGYRWAQNLRPYESPEPQRFLRYYESLAANSSVVVGRAVRATP